MTDKSLKVQILEYLKENGGDESRLDIKTPFIDHILQEDGREIFKTTIESLVTDKYINLADTSYWLMTVKSAGVYRSLAECNIKAKLTREGEYYLKDIVNPTPMNYTDNRSTINVSENNGIIQQGNDYQSSKIKSQIISPSNQSAEKPIKGIIKYIMGILGTLLASYIAYKMGWI